MRFLTTMPWRAAGKILSALALGVALLPAVTGPRVFAQEEADSAASEPAGPSADPPPEVTDEAEDTTSTPPASDEDLRFFTLLRKGGVFMWPILAMAVLVVAFTIERTLGLRRSKVMPNPLIDGLGQLATQPGGFDPRKAYRLCQQYPSAASSVIRSMLLKVGRPHSEVEHTVAEASDREASRMYKNVGWLTLAAAVAPLLGLLGTVWGMILAFHTTTTMPAGSNMAIELGKGIYTALVTTLAGLSVAIPAAILAHFFERRIKDLFLEIDELLFSIMPQVERYEGRLRVSRQSLAGGGEESEPVAAKAAEDQPRMAAAPK